jgi:hypothetical protein
MALGFFRPRAAPPTLLAGPAVESRPVRFALEDPLSGGMSVVEEE